MLSPRWLTALLAVATTLFPVRSLLAQTTPPLNFFRNYFVTGDYVVGGVGLRGLGVNGIATGTINIPDSKQHNATSVPAGAGIVAAFLYWQTVEKSQSAFAGQNGSFNGYTITGTVLGNPNAPVSWSAGGCAGSSNGTTTLRTYRADVRPYLNLDSNGNVLGNGSYPVSLADSGSNGGGTPLTLGASLVIIYRVLSSAVPLNGIVLYDGAFAPSNSSSIMTENMPGFYQAAAGPVAKLTHIVGNGQSNKSEQVSLNNQPLPSLYPGLPPFPGLYNSSWDNPTWSVGQNVSANASSATTSVTPSSNNSGCVSWSAIIFGTTVQDSDKDGLLDTWEDSQGYTDISSGPSNGQWVALPGANKSTPDIFVELDYLSNLDLKASSLAHSHLPKQAALDMVGAAFHNQGINVHFDVGSVYQQDPYVVKYPVSVPSPLPAGTTAPPATAGGNAISEGALLCTDSNTALCAFPGQPAIGWKGGFLFVQKQASLQIGANPFPLGSFEAGRRHSYHYVLFGHSSGAPASSWSTAVAAPTASQGKLISIVDQGATATITLQSAAGFLKPGDDASANRVTIVGAIGQPLNGTYHFTTPANTTAGSVTTTVFTITTSGVADGTYTYANQPQLGLIYGGPTTTSGHSDLGGGDSAITFGLWPADDLPNCQADPSVGLSGQQVYCNDQVGTVQAQAGTLMHELGHTLALTHGGTDFTASPVTFGLNCKPNFLSAMNYLFQIRGFPDGGIDYSGQTLADLNEASLNEAFGIGAAAHFTRWYAPPNALDTQLQNSAGGRYASRHCDGTPIGSGEGPAVRVDGTSITPIDWNNDLNVPDAVNSQDVNFNGVTGDPALPGFNDWQHLDLRQISARENAFGLSAGGGVNFEGGGVNFEGGGVNFEGGGVNFEGGGVNFEGGGVNFEGGGEQDLDTANSTADSVSALKAAQQPAGAHSVTLNWTPPGFGQIRTYYIWRATGSFTTLQSVLANRSSFSRIATLTGAPPVTTYTDTNVKNTTTYTYFVTDANKQGSQSGPSAPAFVTVKF